MSESIHPQAVPSRPHRRSFTRRRRSIRRQVAHAFTLVELLVVVSIIGLLAAIVTSAVMQAIGTANNTAVAVEMGSIGQTFELVKTDFGSYPPSRLFGDEFTNYLQRKFTHYDISLIAGDMDKIFKTFDSGYSYGIDAPDSDRAVVFWLVGFSGDPEDPLRGHAERMLGTKTSNKPYYEFDKERLQDGTYAAKGNTKHSERTFYYIDYREYGNVVKKVGDDEFRAYRKSDTLGTHYNPEGYQIVYPGRDGLLGTGGARVADDVPYGGNDVDNITSFSGNQNMFDFSDE